MHELGLCESILDAVERRAAGRRVTGVRVRVGALHAVVEPALDAAFALVAEGSVADGAAVDLVVVPVVVRCAACGASTESPELVPACPRCGATRIDVTGGDDLVLESISLAREGS